MAELPEHVVANRAYWNGLAAEYAIDGAEKWAAAEPSWGIFGIPESQVGMLPAELDGIEAIELGCGTGYVSAWLARRGARPTGIDSSEGQLATARELQGRFGIEFPLLHGNAEQVPLPNAGFDLAISEYGASIWCDPYAWIPEAARLLRPGGELIFLVNGILAMLCDPDEGEVPAGERLARPLFGMHRMTWSEDTPSVEFHLPHGEMIALLRRSGFEVEGLLELQPPAGASTRYPHVTLEWARQWPCEEVWKARKRGPREA
ncbi:MAG: class I SAM-dependent methyltransferase [Actinobacteria bacterium]|nr:class I SAM-dependent methyltransferase [Actinomycetota bacterium]